MFGPHLMLDFYGCDQARLKNADAILKFLDELPARIGMHKIGGPYLLDCPANSKSWDKGGVSAIVIIAESHISIHTFPGNDGYMNIDIFSCKQFDVEQAVGLISAEFRPSKFEKRLIWRGKEFPKERYEAMREAGMQRTHLKPSFLNAYANKQVHAEQPDLRGMDG